MPNSTFTTFAEAIMVPLSVETPTAFLFPVNLIIPVALRKETLPNKSHSIAIFLIDDET